MNTLEQLVALLPGMYLAAHYWSPNLVAAGGVIYLVGRMVYLRAYLKDPATRTLGFALTVFPILTMLGSVLVGAVMAAAR
jgi:predicted membrane channel-forming protein YqfA (hemolysin III family)